MSYDREQWEEVSFQVITEMDGSVRSGYFPTGEGIVDGNIAVAYTFGNMPIQPNEDRGLAKLGAGDSHKTANTEWAYYPKTNFENPTSRNYMVTGAKFVENEMSVNLYEYTSQNNLRVGDEVRITGCGWANTLATVTYADSGRFRILDANGTGPELTGLLGRVDVVAVTGNTLDSGDSFYWPDLWFCTNTERGLRKVKDVINELVSYGVPREYFVDFTFTGGDTPWYSTGSTPNFDGAILYTYIPADEWGFDDWQGTPVYGTAFDGVVLGANQNGGYKDAIDSGHPEDYMLIVGTNDPRKNNAEWWFD